MRFHQIWCSVWPWHNLVLIRFGCILLYRWRYCAVILTISIIATSRILYHWISPNLICKTLAKIMLFQFLVLFIQQGTMLCFLWFQRENLGIPVSLHLWDRISANLTCKIFIIIMLTKFWLCSLDRGHGYAIFLRWTLQLYLSFYWVELHQSLYMKLLTKNIYADPILYFNNQQNILLNCVLFYSLITLNRS